MTKFKKLSNQDLDHQLGNLVKQERELLSKIILHLREVARRRLYLEMGYPSLFEYLTKHHGYANGSAQRRIDAARLSLDVPTVIADIENGEINLSQVSLLQKSIRQKTDPVPKELKLEILQSLKQKSVQESQVIVSQKLEIKIKAQPKLTHQADRSVRLELTLSEEQWQKLQQMRDLLSHSLPDGSWDQVLEHVADKVIRSQTKARKVRGKSTEHEAEGEGVKSVSWGVLRKQVFVRDACCQQKTKASEKICGSKWQLQVDHIKPKWAGGEDRLENLQLLCSQHNREKYWQESHIRRI